MNEIDMEKANREITRWRVLQVLNVGRPLPVSEIIVLRTLQDIHLPITAHGLRREMDYLRDRKLIEIRDEESPTWSAELTRYGVDIVEYTLPCEPGIARPERWR